MESILNKFVNSSINTMNRFTTALSMDSTYALEISGNSIFDINFNLDESLEFDIIDYDTAEFISDLTINNEEFISIKQNILFGTFNIAKSIEGSVVLVNKNGFELKELHTGENSMRRYPIGLYYIAIKHGNEIKSLTRFYCVK